MRKNDFNSYIAPVIEKACEEFRKNLSNLNLIVIKKNGGFNGCPESNLIFHIAKAFQDEKKGFVFFQPAFRGGNSKNRIDHHYDAYFYDEAEKLGIILEAKRLYSLGKLKEICKDAGRLQHDPYIQNMLKRLKNQKTFRINHMYALIVAETWEDKCNKKPEPIEDTNRYIDWWKNLKNDEQNLKKWNGCGWSKENDEFKKNQPFNNSLSDFDYFGYQKYDFELPLNSENKPSEGFAVYAHKCLQIDL